MVYEDKPFLDAAVARRSIYAINKSSPITNDKIEEIVRQALELCPSPFNSQATRIVVLIGREHDKFWKIIYDLIEPRMTGSDMWEYSKNKLNGFAGGHATVLFYEDQETVKDMQNQYKPYADFFPQWSEHSNAMHQYFLWTAFSNEGFGCSLQHYNPLPNEKAQEIWEVPKHWDLKAQLVIGGLQQGARESLPVKYKVPIDQCLHVHGTR